MQRQEQQHQGPQEQQQQQGAKQAKHVDLLSIMTDNEEIGGSS